MASPATHCSVEVVTTRSIEQVTHGVSPLSAPGAPGVCILGSGDGTSVYHFLAFSDRAREPREEPFIAMPLCFAVPAARAYRPKPCLAWVFAGASIPRTLALLRFTPRSFVCIRLAPAASLCAPIVLLAQWVSSQSKKCGFCFAPFFKHLRVRKMCGSCLHCSNRLLTTVFQQPVRERHDFVPPWPRWPGGSNMRN